MRVKVNTRISVMPLILLKLPFDGPASLFCNNFDHSSRIV